jgi:mannose-6-phosphate isomerase-like protein (cupin superfamily)
MLIKNEEAIDDFKSDKIKIRKYQFPSTTLGLAVANINARYPDDGKVCNEICDETWFVVSGQGTLYHQEGVFNIRQNDAFYLPKGKWYWVETEGLRIVVSTSPPWMPDQQRHLP